MAQLGLLVRTTPAKRNIVPSLIPVLIPVDEENIVERFVKAKLVKTGETVASLAAALFAVAADYRVG